MDIGLIRKFQGKIRAAASEWTYNSPLYKWSLGSHVPEQFLVTLPDVWPGQAEYGRWLCSDGFNLNGHRIEIQGRFWAQDHLGEQCLNQMHGFEWLRDLRALGGDAPRMQARNLIALWCQRYHNWHADYWRADLLGMRVANWIALYPFYGESADEDFQYNLMDALQRQARHLSRVIGSGVEGIGLLHAIRGLTFCGLVFEGREAWLEQALDLLERETGRQILADGGHVSRSPHRQIEATRIFIDIRAALSAGGYPVPEQVEHTIDRMTQALRFFRHTDKSFALFNGGRTGDEAMADAVLMHANARGRTLRSLPCTGYERMTQGRTVVMVDCGTPPPFPYDDQAHAAPLAFEMVYGKERIFVSCGTHGHDKDWHSALRGTAAHNTLTIDHRNVCEIKPDGHFARKPRRVSVERQEAQDAILLDMSHDGYLPLNGITHRRRLFLNRQGHMLRGEDNLVCTTGLNRGVEAAIRFHLHPRVQVSLIRDGQEALLRLQGGAGWRFFNRGGTLKLEDSLYIGDGAQIAKTKQLVIYGRMESDHACIKWGLQREGVCE